MDGWVHGGTALTGPGHTRFSTDCEPLEAFDDAVSGERLQSGYFQGNLEVLSSGYRLASPAAVSEAMDLLDTVADACPVTIAASGAQSEVASLEPPAGGDRATGLAVRGERDDRLLAAYQVGAGLAILELESEPGDARAQSVFEQIAAKLAAKLDGDPPPDAPHASETPGNAPLPPPSLQVADHPLTPALIEEEDLGGNWVLMFADLGDLFEDEEPMKECPQFAGFPALDGVIAAFGRPAGSNLIIANFVGRGAPGDAAEHVHIFERVASECPRFEDAGTVYTISPLAVPTVDAVDALIGVAITEGQTRSEYLVASRGDVVLVVGQFTDEPDDEMFEPARLASLLSLSAERLPD